MKKIILLLTLILILTSIKAQSCEELMDYVKSNSSYPTTYNSPLSTAIKKVTFYTTTIDYKTFYFAIVCFKRNEYSYQCDEYIYQVAYNTRMNYAMKYLDSAGEAFWEYIQPYAKQLDCGAKFN